MIKYSSEKHLTQHLFKKLKDRFHKTKKESNRRLYKI